MGHSRQVLEGKLEGKVDGKDPGFGITTGPSAIHLNLSPLSDFEVKSGRRAKEAPEEVATAGNAPFDIIFCIINVNDLESVLACASHR